jgi:hypothetical protein
MMEFLKNILNWLNLPKQFDMNQMEKEVETNMYDLNGTKPFIYCQELDNDKE